MKEFVVYGFNDSYQMATILTGVVHFMGSGTWATISHTVLAILFFIAVMQFQKVDILTYLRNMFMPFILYMVFFVVPAKINFEDQFSHEVYTVSNVPIGLAFPLYVSSLIEKGFLDVIDDYVRPVTVPAFKDVDYFGHARLMGEVTTTNLFVRPDLQQSLIEFFKDCVMHSIANEQLTIHGIKVSSNLLATFANTNNALFTRRTLPSGKSEVVTCAQAYTAISAQATGAAADVGPNSAFRRGASIWGARGTNGALATASYHSAISAMFMGQQDSAQALFLQNLFINATRASIGTVAPDLLVAMSEAENRHFSSAATAAIIYIKQLPMLRAMFKITLVALFPMIAAMFLVSNGTPFVYWSGCLLWISLWLPAQAAKRQCTTVG